MKRYVHNVGRLDRDIVIAVHCDYGFLLRLWYRSPGMRNEYVGDCSTVWHDRKTGQRPGTFMESWLTGIAWLFSQYENEFSGRAAVLREYGE